MRTLSSTLTAAGKADSRVPYVSAVFDDYEGDRPRMRFTQYYAGAETDFYSACVIAPDGSLVRARQDAGQLYVSRVASPGSGSTYSSWTLLNAAADVQMALCLQDDGVNVMLFYFAVGAVDLKVKVSADNGATWGAAIALLTAPAAATNLCAASIAGDWHAIWNEGANVCWTAGGAFFGVRTVWTNTINACTGLAVYFGGNDFNVVVTGRETVTTDYKVWTCNLGYGGDTVLHAWSGLTEVASAAAASGVSYLLPALTFLVSWRLFFREDYSGALAYSREQWSTMASAESFTNEAWREPQAMRAAITGGVWSACSLTSGASAAVWVCASKYVYHAPWDTSTLDLSDRVLESDVNLESLRGSCRLLLDNADGLLARGSAYGLQIVPGRRLSLSFGYRTSAGAEASTGPAYWVESVEWQHDNRGRAVVEVVAFDGWHYLEVWKARREFVFAAGARVVSQLLTFVCGRAGLRFAALSSSAAVTAISPAFSINAGQSGLAAVRALLGQVPDKIIMDAGVAHLVYPQSSDASSYSFGTDHAILSGRYRATGAAVNRARAFGPALLFDERFDAQDAEDQGERIAQVLDLALTTTTLAGNRAGYMIREADYGQERDEVLVPLQPGLVVYDVVDLTDAGAGLAAAKRRVRSLSFKQRSGPGARPVYELALELGAV